jgi:uncharacterized glyoxalase superfamily protein PhnB
MSEDASTRAQPESLRGRSLSVSITATDLQASLAWWRDVVGFTVQQEHEREGKVVAVSLVAGGVRIILGQDDGAKGWERKKGEGMSIHITTAQDVDQLAARAKAHGGTLDMEPTDMPWGPRAFRLVDPDGFKVTISNEG